jgi:hypothetical protein
VHCTKITELFAPFGKNRVLEGESVVILGTNAGLGLSLTGSLISFQNGQKSWAEGFSAFLE